MQNIISLCCTLIVCIIGGVLSTTHKPNQPNRLATIEPMNPLQPLERIAPIGRRPPVSRRSRAYGPFTLLQKISYQTRVDFLKLAIIWQPGHKFKYDSHMHSEPRFSLHGLWPSNLTGRTPLNCVTDIEFDMKHLKDLNTLSKIWPASMPNLSNEKLWQSQWERHGTCTIHLVNFGTVTSYFKNALKFFARLALNAKASSLIANHSDIYPIGSQLVFDLLRYHNDKFYEIEARCEKLNGVDYLIEIRFCLSIDERNELIDCPRLRTNCDGDKILLLGPRT